MTDEETVQAWKDKFGDPDKMPLKETLEMCQQEFDRQGRIRDVLDRGLEMLLAGVDIDPELHKEGQTAANLLRLHEEEERETFRRLVMEGAKTQHFMGVDWIVTNKGRINMKSVRPEGEAIKTVAYIGTPKTSPNLFEEMFRLASQIGSVVQCHGDGGPKSGFEEADEPVIVEAHK